MKTDFSDLPSGTKPPGQPTYYNSAAWTGWTSVSASTNFM